jgi:hypothetical protein
MAYDDDDSTDQLDDAQLMTRELRQHDEFERIGRADPRFRDTTYGRVHGSVKLVEAWNRWWKTNVAARARGLVSRGSGR